MLSTWTCWRLDSGQQWLASKSKLCSCSMDFSSDDLPTVWTSQVAQDFQYRSGMTRFTFWRSIHHGSAGQPSDQESLVYRVFLQRLSHFVLVLPTCFLQAGKQILLEKKYTPVDPKQLFHIHCSVCVCVHVYAYTSSWRWQCLIHVKWEQHESQATFSDATRCRILCHAIYLYLRQ